MEEAGIEIIGAGGHAKVVVATLLERGVPVARAYSREPHGAGAALLAVPISHGEPSRVERGVIAVGDNRARQMLAQRVTAGRWETVVHPRAYVHASATLGAGVVVFAGAVVQPDAVIGDHVILNTGATIDHDCRVEAFAHVAPGAHLAGGVTVGEGALVGIGSAVAPGRSIGAWARVGAGAAVLRDVAAGTTVVGVPARARSLH